MLFCKRWRNLNSNETKQQCNISGETNLELVESWLEQDDELVSWELVTDVSLEEKPSEPWRRSSDPAFTNEIRSSLTFVAFSAFLAFLELGFLVKGFLSFFLFDWFFRSAWKHKWSQVTFRNQTWMTNQPTIKLKSKLSARIWLLSAYICDVTESRTFSWRCLLGWHICRSFRIDSVETL